MVFMEEGMQPQNASLYSFRVGCPRKRLSGCEGVKGGGYAVLKEEGMWYFSSK